MDIQNGPGETGCGVPEELFPAMRKCCVCSGVGALQRYQSICPYCKIRTLPPAGENLEVATIFECRNLGYFKRVKE